MYYLWAFLASVCAIGLEYWYRGHQEFPVWAFVPAILVSYMIYLTMQNPVSYLAGVVAFSAFNVSMRIGLSVFVLQESLDSAQVARVAALSVAALIPIIWR